MNQSSKPDKPHPARRVRAAGILLMATGEHPPQFLLMRHHDRWDLPKGHCKEGETFRQAALRETEEETGIAPDTISLDPSFSFELAYPVTYAHLGNETFEKQVRYFLGYVKTKTRLRLTEHESAQWLAWDPPHKIQAQTIDPLLAAVAEHLREQKISDD
jgi:8-oxo-dGTP pyrophosphatase MutT (NUDIX family)